MKRVLVVPWSIAPMYLPMRASLILSPVELLAQARLPELPGGSAWNRLQEFEALRQLPLHKLLCEVRAQVFRTRGRSGPEHDARERALAPLLVRNCDHGCFRNGRVSHQLVL